MKHGALALLAALFCGAATAQITAIKQTQQLAISGTLQTPSIDGLLVLRDDAFERRRKELFADARFMADLRTQPASSDPAAQFAARVLARWAVDAPPAYAALEHFITVEEPQLRATNRSAAGGGGSTALLKHSAQYQDLPEVLDYLLLRSLTRPNTEPWVYGGLMRYFRQKPIHEPEVWLRIALERNDLRIAEQTATQFLQIADKGRTLSALNAERARLLQKNKTLPDSLETLRRRLSAGE